MKLWAILLVMVALVLAGCSSSGSAPKSSAPAAPKTPGKITVHGTIVLSGVDAERQDDPLGSQCWTSGNIPPPIGTPGPYDDIKEGAQVVITNAAGATVGLGTLTAGKTTTAVAPGANGHPDCAYSFIALSVPSGQSFYGVKVGTRSKQVPGSQIASAVVTLP